MHNWWEWRYYLSSPPYSLSNLRTLNIEWVDNAKWITYFIYKTNMPSLQSLTLHSPLTPLLQDHPLLVTILSERSRRLRTVCVALGDHVPETLRIMASWTTIRHLHLQSGISDSDVQVLARSLPKLKSLAFVRQNSRWVSGSRLTGKGILTLLAGCRQLTHLEISADLSEVSNTFMTSLGTERAYLDHLTLLQPLTLPEQVEGAGRFLAECSSPRGTLRLTAAFAIGRDGRKRFLDEFYRQQKQRSAEVVPSATEARIYISLDD